MKKITYFLTCVLSFAPFCTNADTIKVLTTGAYKQMVLAMAPSFEKQTGHQLEIQNDTAGALVKRIENGESFDVLVLTPAGINSFVKADRLSESSVTLLAKVAIGMAIRSGEPVPKLATLEDFKQILQQSKKVAYINPSSGGSSGIYLDGLFQRLGMTEMLKNKSVLVNGGLVADKLVSKEADLAIHQVSEILPVNGVTLIGTLPEEIQNYTVYVGAINKTTKHPSEAKAFLSSLTSPTALEFMKSKGMLSADKPF